jgi:hypothetical protein
MHTHYLLTTHYCTATTPPQGHNPNFSVRKVFKVAQDMYDLKKRGASLKQASHSVVFSSNNHSLHLAAFHGSSVINDSGSAASTVLCNLATAEQR